MREKPNLEAVSDDGLLRALSEILKTSRWAEADLVAHIAEIDARRLYAREAAPSMFAYCSESCLRAGGCQLQPNTASPAGEPTRLTGGSTGACRLRGAPRAFQGRVAVSRGSARVRATVPTDAGK